MYLSPKVSLGSVDVLAGGPRARTTPNREILDLRCYFSQEERTKKVWSS